MRNQTNPENSKVVTFRTTGNFKKEIQRAAAGMELAPAAFVRLAIRDFIDRAKAKAASK